MNPRRLHALFNAWFRPAQQQTGSRPSISIGGKPTRYVDFDDPHTDGLNLAEYFKGR